MNLSMEKSQSFLNRRLLKLALPLRLAFGSVILVSLGGGLLVIAQAYVLSQVIDRVYLGKQVLAQVSTLLLAFGGIILGRSVLTVLAEGLAGQCALQIKTGLRERLFKHFFAIGPAYLEGKSTGDLAARTVQGIGNLDEYFSQYLPQVILAAVLPISILIFVFPLDLLSGIILLFTAPLIPVFMYLIGKYAETLTQKQFLALSRMSAVFLDTLQGLATLKTLSQSQARSDKIRVASDHYRKATLGVLRVTFLSALVLELVGTLSTAIVAVEIGLRLLNSQVDFSQAFFILVIAPEFYLPLRQLGLRFHAGAAGVSAARAIFEVLDEPVKVSTEIGGEAARIDILDNPNRPGNQSSTDFEITFDHVSFAYPDNKQDALQEVSFTFKASEITLLVGASGSGKSTAAQLILRLIEPQEGRILINQVPLAAYDIYQWRRLVAWAPQRPYLFQSSFLDNFRVAKKDASLAEVRHAATLAELDDFIQSLPAGYETVIGERSARLSGGQAQRLALARAFLKDSPILILDEPEANLDQELRNRIQANILSLCHGRTILVIGHHMQNLRQSGQIVVLENGRIVQTGRHTELVAKAGAYTRLCEQEDGEA
jgi:ATP-binding cassette subfamily C protein CydD